VDVAKYRTLFLEEATEHLAEIGQALLVLEKDLRAGDALDTVFRLMHSMKGMGASLGYDAVSLLAIVSRTGSASGRSAAASMEGTASRCCSAGSTASTRWWPRARDRRSAAARCRADGRARRARAGKKSPAPAVAGQAPPPSPEAARVAVPRPPPSIRVPNETLDRFLSTVGEVILTTTQCAPRRTAAAPTRASRAGSTRWTASSAS
jgi:chemotaxis protein histidine kinase CheA